MSCFFLRLYLCCCLGGSFSIAWGQSLPQQIESALQLGDFLLALELSDSLVQKQPEIFAAVNPNLFQLEKIREERELRVRHIRALLRIYRFNELNYPSPEKRWLRNQGFVVIMYRDSLPRVYLPVLRRCLEIAPDRMPSSFLEHYSEEVLGQVESGISDPVPWIDEFCFLENLWLNLDTWNPAQVAQAGVYRLRIVEALQTQIPDCRQLQTEFQSSLDQDLLRPQDYRYIYTCLRLRGCARSAFRDTVLRRYPEIAGTAYAFRVASLEIQSQGEYLIALSWLERSVAVEKRPCFKAQDYLRLAELYRQISNFRTARLYVEFADQTLASWGRPYLFLAEMVVQSGPFCNFTPLEQKAIYWLGIDYCEMAMNRNPRLENEAIKQIQQYRKEMPSREELIFYGFQLGDSFPLRCWLETATRVRY